MRPGTFLLLALTAVLLVPLTLVSALDEKTGVLENGGWFTGEVMARPQSRVEVVAGLWGKIILESGLAPGVRVKKDQNLAKVILELNALERLPLNDRTIEVDQFLDTATKKVRSALDDYRRAQRIGTQNPNFQKEVDRRKAIYENAVKEYQMATQQKTRQEGVMRTRDPRTVIIKSPISGIIDEIDFVPGEMNKTDEYRRLFTIVDLSAVWVRADIYEKDMPLFRRASKTVITTEAFPGRTFPGTFQTFGSEIDPATRTIPVYYEVQNPGEKLRIGLRVQVRPITTAR